MEKIFEGGNMEEYVYRHPSGPIKEHPFKRCVRPLPPTPFEWISDNKSKEETEGIEIIVQQGNE